jgi:hypothetical protein
MPIEIRTDSSRAGKYRLARAVLIQHFACPVSPEEQPGTAPFSHLFPSLESAPFREYLDIHPLHFFLGSKDDSEDGFQLRGADRRKTPLEMLYLMSAAGYCVAFIEGIEFKSSKVRLPRWLQTLSGH